MTILNKALTRPAALWGVPLVPLLFTLCILTLAAVWSRFYWLLLLLIPAFIELRRLAKEDIHFFDLKLLAFKTRGNRAATRHFGTKALVANQYDAIDVTEFIKHMRLNESIPLSRYLPWSSHLHEQVVKNKKGDFVSTWEIGGTIFECEDEHYLATLDMQLNNVIRSFEGLPVTFYTHLVTNLPTRLNVNPGFRFQMKSRVCFTPPARANLSTSVASSSPSASIRTPALSGRP